jgi:hypothetical protein
MTRRSDVVTVFSTGSVALLAYAKSVLDGDGLVYIVNGEYIHNTFGPALWGGSLAFLLGPMEIQVALEDESRARELLTDIKEGSAEDA